MRVQITHLKAPWPRGAVVGDVIELATVPGWAVGKCAPASDDAEVTIEMVAAVDGDGSGQALPSVEAVNAQIADLQAKLDASLADNETLLNSLTEADAKLADLQAKLEAAQSEEGKAKAALVEAEQQAAQEKAAIAASTKGTGKK